MEYNSSLQEDSLDIEDLNLAGAVRLSTPIHPGYLIREILAKEVMFMGPIKYFTIAHGADSSVRVFLSFPTSDSVPFNRSEAPISPGDLATELEKFSTTEARLPEKKISPEVPGWELFRTMIGGKNAIVAKAAWCTPHKHT